MGQRCLPPHVLHREVRPHPTDPDLMQDRLVCETHEVEGVGGWDWDDFDPITKERP